MNVEPLCFSAELIQAILDGRKVQARRLLKPQPPAATTGWVRESGRDGKWLPQLPSDAPPRQRLRRAVCPYGEPGQLVSLQAEDGSPFARALLVGARPQRLQDISDADVAAEGCINHSRAGAFLPGMPLKSVFALTWCEAHGPRSWAANPWVWVLELRVQGPVVPGEPPPPPVDPRQQDLLRAAGG